MLPAVHGEGKGARGDVRGGLAILPYVVVWILPGFESSGRNHTGSSKTNARLIEPPAGGVSWSFPGSHSVDQV
jgi:hypothetical protein